MSTATTSNTVTNFPMGPARQKKILVAVPSPISGNIDGTEVYEIHDGSEYARVRLERGQDVEELVNIIGDLKFLYVYGRHDISRIHLFIARDMSDRTFKFAATYSQVYKIGLLCGLDSVYANLKTHCDRPVSMAMRFKIRGVLASDGRREWEPTAEEENYYDFVGDDTDMWL